MTTAGWATGTSKRRTRSKSKPVVKTYDLPFALVMDEAAARACSAREMTRAQCALFDRVLAAAA